MVGTSYARSIIPCAQQPGLLLLIIPQRQLADLGVQRLYVNSRSMAASATFDSAALPL
jgi:hypothetical protein